jgi:hypothetical protein
MHLKLRILLLCLLLGAATLPAQLSCGLKGGLGMSRITVYFRSELTQVIVFPSASASLGFYGQLDLGKRFSLRSEVLASLITDHYRSKTFSTDANGTPTTEFSVAHIWRNVSYLSVPLMVGFKVDRLDLFVGAQASVALNSWGRASGRIPLGDSTVPFETRYPTMNVQPFDFGPKAAAAYSLSDRFSLEMSYYHGLMAIQEAPNFPWPFRVRQLLLGLNWRMSGPQKGF